jgi:hypothetical protein
MLPIERTLDAKYRASARSFSGASCLRLEEIRNVCEIFDGESSFRS